MSTLGISVSMSVKRALTSLQIAQFVVGLAWGHSYLFVSYKGPIQVAESPFHPGSASSLHPNTSRNHSSMQETPGKVRKVTSDGAVTCLSDSGETFCLIVAVLYLIPLIALFVQFFMRSYKRKKE